MGDILRTDPTAGISDLRPLKGQPEIPGGNPPDLQEIIIEFIKVNGDL